MKLDNKQIIKHIKGAIRIFEENEWISFSRFTESQKEYLNKNERQELHSKSDSGIKMEFVTNSGNFKFSYIPEYASESQECFVDIYVDGVMKLHHGNNPIVKELQNVELELGGGDKKITVYFPGLFFVKIKDVEIDDGASIIEAKSDRKFLILGDSITQGCNAIFPSISYANLLAASFNAELVNQGIAGDIFNYEQLDESLPYSPDTVFVSYGTNGHGEPDFEDTVVKYFDKLFKIYPKEKVYVILPIWRLDIEGREDRFIKSRSFISETVKKYANAYVIDTIDFVPRYKEFFYDGTLHPNELGYLYYADGVIKAVREFEEK